MLQQVSWTQGSYKVGRKDQINLRCTVTQEFTRDGVAFLIAMHSGENVTIAASQGVTGAPLALGLVLTLTSLPRAEWSPYLRLSSSYPSWTWVPPKWPCQAPYWPSWIPKNIPRDFKVPSGVHRLDGVSRGALGAALCTSPWTQKAPVTEMGVVLLKRQENIKMSVFSNPVSYVILYKRPSVVKHNIIFMYQ